MELPTWDHLDGKHFITVQQGKAVILEDVVNGEMLYKPHIEENMGIIVSQFEPGFENFETADAFIRANLIELDRIGVDETAFRQKLTETLDICLKLLTQSSRTFHRVRVENIKRWLLDPFGKLDRLSIPRTDWAKYTFEWQQSENRYECETMHGKAIVTELPMQQSISYRLGTKPSYAVQIEDVTGVVLKDHYAPVPDDFLSAETRIRKILSDLEQPYIDENFVDKISFTLQICLHLLPFDTDPMNFVRLRYIDYYLGEVLP